ncbi:hypothetical protein NS201_10795 [Pseudomonas oryzihabitans]|nr:hypothetical protein NS201_10795 [Pseudomonas psychrotolerans]
MDFGDYMVLFGEGRYRSYQFFHFLFGHVNHGSTMPCGLDLLLLLQQKVAKEMLVELILSVKIELPDLVMINS